MSQRASRSRPERSFLKSKPARSIQANDAVLGWPSGSFVKEAGDLMHSAYLHELRRFNPASLHRITAAGVKGASRWWIDRRRHVALDQGRQAFGRGVCQRNRSQQRLRIWMTRVCEQLGLFGDLDDASEIHHRNAMTDMRDYR